MFVVVFCSIGIKMRCIFFFFRGIAPALGLGVTYYIVALLERAKSYFRSVIGLCLEGIEKEVNCVLC